MSWLDRARDGLDQFRHDAQWRNFQGGRDEIGWSWIDDDGGEWALFDTRLNGLEGVDPSDEDYFSSALGDLHVYDSDDPDLEATQRGWWWKVEEQLWISPVGSS